MKEHAARVSSTRTVSGEKDRGLLLRKGNCCSLCTPAQGESLWAGWGMADILQKEAVICFKAGTGNKVRLLGRGDEQLEGQGKRGCRGSLGRPGLLGEHARITRSAAPTCTFFRLSKLHSNSAHDWLLIEHRHCMGGRPPQGSPPIPYNPGSWMLMLELPRLPLDLSMTIKVTLCHRKSRTQPSPSPSSPH